jgi:hypothetical protein
MLRWLSSHDSKFENTENTDETLVTSVSDGEGRIGVHSGEEGYYSLIPVGPKVFLKVTERNTDGKSRMIPHGFSFLLSYKAEPHLIYTDKSSWKTFEALRDLKSIPPETDNPK